MMQSLSRDYEEEAILFSKVWKIVRNTIFNNETNFSGNLNEYESRHNIPLTSNLISMILFGKEINSDTAETDQCKMLALLCRFNVKKKQNVQNNSRRKNLERQQPISIYLGLSIYKEIRDEKVIEKLYQLGLSISYDRVLQIWNCFGHNATKQAEIENLACPRKLRKGIYTIGAFENIDYNPSSTSAKRSFHGTGISIIQTPEFKDKGRDPILLLEIISTDKKIELTHKFTVAKAVSTNQKAIEVPLKSTQKTIFNISDELVKKKKNG